jgi:hypothetical protein
VYGERTDRIRHEENCHVYAWYFDSFSGFRIYGVFQIGGEKIFPSVGIHNSFRVYHADEKYHTLLRQISKRPIIVLHWLLPDPNVFARVVFLDQYNFEVVDHHHVLCIFGHRVQYILKRIVPAKRKIRSGLVCLVFHSLFDK